MREHLEKWHGILGGIADVLAQAANLHESAEKQRQLQNLLSNAATQVAMLREDVEDVLTGKGEPS